MPTDTIYFLLDASYPAIKIGITNKLMSRCKGLQVGNPNKLWIIGVFDGDLSTEERLQKHFTPSRIRGSWYKITDELRDFIIENRDQKRTLKLLKKQLHSSDPNVIIPLLFSLIDPKSMDPERW